MTIYKTRWFARWARKEGLSDEALCQATDDDEEAALRKLATVLLTMSSLALANALRAGELIEVKGDA